MSRNKMSFRALCLSLVGALFLGNSYQAKADKGMWVLSEMNKENIAKLKELGFRLSVDSLYSLDKPSIASSVVIFGGGCTGITVSNQGLIFTNHHCGYDAIQSQSTVDHDYLKDGFVSKTFKEELPIEGLKVKYLSTIKDVTEELTKGTDALDEKSRLEQLSLRSKKLIAAENQRQNNPHKEVIIEAFYAGNKYYMITYDVFSDVRMVFAPPSSVGKFGGDTDNWMWPRHTGDFSVFRVYAGKDNKPAAYSKDNKPYHPKSYATVSMDGYKEGDFAMTIGFPGSTQRYIPSWGVANRMNAENAAMIEVRGIKQEIWRKAMDSDQATRIKYDAKYAQSANYWKNSIGMNRGLERLKVLDRKREEEAAFQKWANKPANKAKYGAVLADLETAYKENFDFRRNIYYLVETLLRGVELVGFGQMIGALPQPDPQAQEELLSELKAFYKDYSASLDLEVLPAMLDLLKKRVPSELVAAIYKPIDEQYKGDLKAYAASFKNSLAGNEERLMQLIKEQKWEEIAKDPSIALALNVMEALAAIRKTGEKSGYDIARGNRLYFAGRQEKDPKRAMPSDANFTMRMSYGTIQGYSPSDAVDYNYYTTERGLFEKYDPNNSEFAILPSVLKVLNERSWGKYADKKDKHLHTCFLTTNDITGGNSGSPVFNKDGRLFGLAFDGNWEAMSGDIEFEPELQRTIVVDIRYVLYVIDKWGKADRLIKELRFK